jgi:hypothetical protein
MKLEYLPIGAMFRFVSQKDPDIFFIKTEGGYIHGDFSLNIPLVYDDSSWQHDVVPLGMAKTPEPVKFPYIAKSNDEWRIYSSQYPFEGRSPVKGDSFKNQTGSVVKFESSNGVTWWCGGQCYAPIYWVGYLFGVRFYDLPSVCNICGYARLNSGTLGSPL